MLTKLISVNTNVVIQCNPNEAPVHTGEVVIDMPPMVKKPCNPQEGDGTVLPIDYNMHLKNLRFGRSRIVADPNIEEPCDIHVVTGVTYNGNCMSVPEYGMYGGAHQPAFVSWKVTPMSVSDLTPIERKIVKLYNRARFYHSTPERKIPSIREKGLLTEQETSLGITEKEKKNIHKGLIPKGVYLSDNLGLVALYTKRGGGVTLPVLLSKQQQPHKQSDWLDPLRVKPRLKHVVLAMSALLYSAYKTMTDPYRLFGEGEDSEENENSVVGQLFLLWAAGWAAVELARYGLSKLVGLRYPMNGITANTSDAIDAWTPCKARRHTITDPFENQKGAFICKDNIPAAPSTPEEGFVITGPITHEKCKNIQGVLETHGLPEMEPAEFAKHFQDLTERGYLIP